MDENVRILIVDDDENIRRTMQTIFENEGYIVDLATTGNEAIELTQERTYNIALLDIRLPDIEGVELLNLIKDNVPKTRKIMVTGYPSMQNAISSLNKNADAYLIKPVGIESLLSTVKEQLRLQKEEKKFTEQKVAEFIEIRTRRNHLLNEVNERNRKRTQKKGN
ncbi:MAG TPA: response regulator [Candidatus Bathyarchaeia archaeon]|nr:response regulator [Candidatus Bathyarchaeia archaeon]